MHVLWRGSLLQRLRLVSGLLLFAFALTHFLNHALGLIGLDAMVAFDGWRVAVTRSVAGSAVLALALAVHAGAALFKVARRRTFRLPRWEWVQLAFGLAIPLLLLPHVVNTRVANLVFGVDTSYPYELTRIWTDTMASQSLLLLLVWVHGCLGLHYWLRLTGGYRRWAPWLLVLATLLPAAALMGIVTQGREMARRNADPARFAALRQATRWPDPVATAAIVRWRTASQIGFGALALLALGIAVAATLRQRRAMRIPVQYVNGPLVKSAEGPTLLEVSRMHRIPHMSVCGGRARCSTCRVLVVGDMTGLAEASAAESETLRAVHAPANVRLACQARVRDGVTVLPLVRSGGAADAPVFVRRGDAAGVERDLAVLFVDIRGFTALTDQKLAYDVVYLLNQFFHAIGQAVYGSGGWVNDRAGDGVLAVFDHPSGLGSACRAALQACTEVDQRIDQLNERLGSELAQPLRVAMGLHCGRHVLGRIGVGEAMTLSVVGPAVNIASRLEALAKLADVQLAMSADTAANAGIDCADLPIQSTPIRGARQPIEVVLVTKARLLLPLLAVGAAPTSAGRGHPDAP